MSIHTPGPWIIDGWLILGAPYGKYAVRRHSICRVHANLLSSIANASLIAAAPELLEIAESIIADDMIKYLPNEYVAKVRAVIAKATGEKND